MNRDEPKREPLMTQILELSNRIVELEQAQRIDQRHRRLEARIQEAQKLQSFTEIAVGAAHDFNNLLVAIRGNVDLALMKLSPSSEARVFIERIGTASELAADLSSHLLDFTKRRPMNVERVDLNRLIEEMADLLRSSISRRVCLGLRLAESLPWIDADATQIRQVAMNLIKNAAEAIDGAGSVTVSTAALELGEGSRQLYRPATFHPRGPYVCLEVADTGRGMDRETQAAIFDPFYTTKAEGHGLGLAAVLGIVRAHSGGIAIDSEAGRGTRFQVLLPACREPNARGSGKSGSEE